MGRLDQGVQEASPEEDGCYWSDLKLSSQGDDAHTPLQAPFLLLFKSAINGYRASIKLRAARDGVGLALGETLSYTSPTVVKMHIKKMSAS